MTRRPIQLGLAGLLAAGLLAACAPASVAPDRPGADATAVSATEFAVEDRRDRPATTAAFLTRPSSQEIVNGRGVTQATPTFRTSPDFWLEAEGYTTTIRLRSSALLLDTRQAVKDARK